MDARRQGHESFQLAFADDVVGNKNIVKARIGHDLGFAHFLTGNANSAGVHLHFGNCRNFMRLDVRTICDLMFIQIRLQPRDIRFHAIHIYHRDRGLQVADVHGLFVSHIGDCIDLNQDPQ